MDVELWEEEKEFPTYEVGPPAQLPMFLENRVYQGSSGKVYPWPVIESVADESVLKRWKLVVLQNRYLTVWILPSLGGRIHRIIDRTNGHDAVYFNRVVKPALVGLTGPWISGGIEFNWPQHHRPSTFSPVDYTLVEEGGAKAVVVSEVDRMYGTKGEAVFTLRPDWAVLEIRGRLYNPTAFPQTFLWWANPAIVADDGTQSVFPPDVTAVFDHGRRDVSRFPVATGTYYKTDYSAGVDISRYRNIPVPTSYMAWKSRYDFVGAYNHDRRSGLLHVADHHVSPGKKQWTWGHAAFGRAWDRHLTDEDGPYIELMTGVFTDNQPDFTWLAPHEEKTFTQHFLPYRDLGRVSNASAEAAVALSWASDTLTVGVTVTRPRQGVVVTVARGGRLLVTSTADLVPGPAWTATLVDAEAPGLTVTVRHGGETLVAYTHEAVPVEPLPAPAQAIGAPADLPDAEALWLAGQHLEQYRHATFDPEAYYREGLRRAPRDLRLNSALGVLLLRRGLAAEAEPLLRTALATLTRHNANPVDGEVSYHLGTCLAAQGRWDEAEEAWGKAAWSAAWQNPAQFALAQAAGRRGELNNAEVHCRASLVRNSNDLAARHLLAAALRRQGRAGDAAAVVADTLALDPLDAGALWEAGLAGRPGWEAVAEDYRTSLGLAARYLAAGFADDALGCLPPDGPDQVARHPLVWYRRARILESLGRGAEALEAARQGAGLGPNLVFPNTLDELADLEAQVVRLPSDARAWLYLGHLLYDKKRYPEAEVAWAHAVEAEPGLAIAWRNLAVVRHNKRGATADAAVCLDRARDLERDEARLLLERDQLHRRQATPPGVRLAALEAAGPLVERRDDLCVELATLLSTAGRWAEARERLLSRRFHVWEGGEGKVLRQFVRAVVGLGRSALARGRADEAVARLTEALDLPASLGEERLPGASEAELWYELGRAEQAAGRQSEAARWWKKAAAGTEPPSGMLYYNDSPPEQVFYRGLARRALGDEAGARQCFHSLVDYGERHLFDHVTLDYFAVSLPDLSVFDEDLDRRNRVHCRFLVGLGRAGLGDAAAGREAWEKAAAEDPSHPGVADALRG